MDDPPISLLRVRKLRKMGLRVAKDAAARPMPVSSVDQIATSVVA